ncbi:hypothetical protein BofuT4_P127710.1 [Botrytis cinerea T4]|uniref:Uncharacterized protein n=1 Tax=Botryotinia fuckeliana (strain T4) TaxID=999810 RepID=G2YSX5_BOTF4|nr:hypothetical protein BofuT4_P127710.1 [Botrytis cinerea T4]
MCVRYMHFEASAQKERQDVKSFFTSVITAYQYLTYRILHSRGAYLGTSMLIQTEARSHSHSHYHNHVRYVKQRTRSFSFSQHSHTDPIAAPTIHSRLYYYGEGPKEQIHYDCVLILEAQYGEKQHTICTYGSRIEFVVNLHSSIQGPNPSTPYDLQHRPWVVLVSARDRHKILDKFSTTHRLFQLFCFEGMLQRSCEHKRFIFSEVIDVSIQSIVQFFDADSESLIPCLSNQLCKSNDTASLLRDSLAIPTKVAVLKNVFQRFSKHPLRLNTTGLTNYSLSENQPHLL